MPGAAQRGGWLFGPAEPRVIGALGPADPRCVITESQMSALTLLPQRYVQCFGLLFPTGCWTLELCSQKEDE